MLALLYFPAEHKYVVYTPLFAPAAAPLIAAVVREILVWRRSRKASKTPTAAAEESQVAERPKTE